MYRLRSSRITDCMPELPWFWFTNLCSLVIVGLRKLKIKPTDSFHGSLSNYHLRVLQPSNAGKESACNVGDLALIHVTRDPSITIAGKGAHKVWKHRSDSLIMCCKVPSKKHFWWFIWVCRHGGALRTVLNKDRVESQSTEDRVNLAREWMPAWLGASSLHSAPGHVSL